MSGVFNGIGESIEFTAGSLLNYYFAIIRSLNGKKPKSVYMKHYFGYYWTATPTGSVSTLFHCLHRQLLVIFYESNFTTNRKFNKPDVNNIYLFNLFVLLETNRLKKFHANLSVTSI